MALLSAALGLVVLGLGVPSASARVSHVTHSLKGGGSIVAAPTLPLDQTVASGWSDSDYVDNTKRYGEFWKLGMNAGDRLVIGAAPTFSSCYTAGQADANPAIYIYAGSVTDDTISQASEVAVLNSSSPSKAEYSWVAPSSGSWILFFTGCLKYSYKFEATIQLFTATALTKPPPYVRRHSRLQLSGTTSGGASGAVLLKITGPHKLNFHRSVPLANGRFRFVYKPRLVGGYHIRAVYGGDTHHRPSHSRGFKVRVG